MVKADLAELAAESIQAGPLWSTESEDLDCTFVNWRRGEGVAEHINTEVDVVMVVIAGSGTVQVDGEVVVLGVGNTLVIEKGTRRSVVAGPAGFAYLNVHKRRRRLMPGNLSDRPRP